MNKTGTLTEQQLEELLDSRRDQTRRPGEPCTVVIFGASGDLTARKLIPALYHLALEKLLPPCPVPPAFA